MATAANLLGSLLLLMLADNSVLLVFADRLVGFRGCGVPDLDLSEMKLKQTTTKVCYGKYVLHCITVRGQDTRIMVDVGDQHWEG